MKVAIIGSGPAGLTCANNLVNANKEIKVTIYDEQKEFGGMIAYGIPQFRVPLTNIREQIEFAKTKGIKFIQKKVESIVELLGEYDKVVIATGAGEGFSLGLPGEESENVIDALEFLKYDKLENKHLCANGNVGVVGGGNAAIDAARVAQKQGASVTVIYRRTEKEMPAFGNEFAEAKKDGIKFEFLRTPTEYVEGDGKIKVICSIMKLGEIDASGRASPVDTSEKVEMVFDKVLLAIGQRNNLKWLEKDGIKTKWNNITVTDYRTSIPNVFACGDVIYGAKNIGEATMSGINCAKEILKNL